VEDLAGQRNATIYWKQELEEAHVCNLITFRCGTFDLYRFDTGKNSGAFASKCRTKKTSNLEFESSSSSR
jgi:hypothetical protein